MFYLKINKKEKKKLASAGVSMKHFLRVSEEIPLSIQQLKAAVFQYMIIAF